MFLHSGRSATLGLFVLTAAALTGCGPVLQQGTPLSVIQQEDAGERSIGYRLQPGDQIEVHHILDPDYSAVVVIAPDGNISVPGIPQPVQARGTTIGELTDKLNQLYRSSNIISKPFFSLNLRGFGNLQIFVGGEVERPGFLEVAGGDRYVMQVIMAGGGFLSTARRDEVIILRNKPDGTQEIFSVNLMKVIDGTDLSQNVRVRPMDVVLVPKSDVASFNTWIEQYIRNSLPISTSGSLTLTNQTRSY
jgi:polysaccharide export outer membrane protein